MYEKLTQCPLCKSGHFNNFMVVKDHAVSQESFSISRCERCDFLFTNPRPDKAHISQYYASKNYISHQNSASNLTNFLYKIVRKITLKQKVAWINEFAKNKGRLLDFGCGTGHFLEAAQKDGWTITGFEPNPTALSISKNKLPMKVYGELSDLETEKKFDAITLFHVLEHVHDLEPTMKLLYEKLKQRGNLYIAVPNFNSYDSILYKENWASLDVPRHLYHFTADTMEQLAKQYQLKIKTIKPMLFDSYYVSILSEGYINNKNKIIRGIKNGYKSNKIAEEEKNHSSLLFVLKKA